MAIAFKIAAIANEADPTTTFTITIPATVVAGDYLEVAATSLNHNATDPSITCVDNDTGGNTWQLGPQDASRKGNVFWKFATAGSAGKTVTIAGALNSSCGGINVYTGVRTTTPITNFSEESNAAANEVHASITPVEADSMICFGVFNQNGQIAVTGVTCTNPGALTQRFEDMSAGGADCACTVWSRVQVGGPTATGTISWSQTDVAQKSIVWCLAPAVAAGGARVGPVVDSGIIASRIRGALAR